MSKHTSPSSGSKAADLVSPEQVKTALLQMVPVPPVILSLKQAANLSHYTPGTLRKLVSQGRFEGSAIRGKPLRFWRDTFVLEVVNHRQTPRAAKPLDESKSGGKSGGSTGEGGAA